LRRRLRRPVPRRHRAPRRGRALRDAGRRSLEVHRHHPRRLSPGLEAAEPAAARLGEKGRAGTPRACIGRGNMTALRHAQADTPSFMADPAAETMSRDALAALQLERLKSTIARAYERVPHHRAAMNELGFAPGDLKSLDDLERLPFTVKGHLREHYPFGLFAVPREALLRVHASSGTTGKP